MSNIFGAVRRAEYVVIFLLSAVELGIAANMTNLFLQIHHDYLIYSLIPPSLTILAILALLAGGRPQLDIPVLIVLSIAWLTLGAWTVDMIGYVQCDVLAGQLIYTSIGATYSSQSYCYQMKTIEAISWALFCFCMIACALILALAVRKHASGDEEVWGNNIDELRWWGDIEEEQQERVQQQQRYAQYAPVPQAQTQTQYPQYPQYVFPGQQPLSQGQYYGQPVIVQQPGQEIRVQQTPNGPQVTRTATTEPRRHERTHSRRGSTDHR